MTKTSKTRLTKTSGGLPQGTMSIEATHPGTIPAPAQELIHPAWLRITHWINFIAVAVMIGSGWEIYNASPLFPFVFPRSITLGGWLADRWSARVRRAGHTGQVIIRADSGFENHQLMKVLDARGIAFSIGMKLSKTIRALIEQIDETAWVTVADYPDGGQAQVAETQLKGFRLIVRRTRLVGAQAELFPDWRHHCFATNRTIPTLVADTDHRDHATIELAIRDLIDQALAHFPSGRMHANSAWTVIAAIAHNLGRWTSQIGLPNAPVRTARTRRDQLLAVPARLTRTSRQWTLRMPARWPWQHQFNTILDRIRALPALT